RRFVTGAGARGERASSLVVHRSNERAGAETEQDGEPLAEVQRRRRAHQEAAHAQRLVERAGVLGLADGQDGGGATLDLLRDAQVARFEPEAEPGRELVGAGEHRTETETDAATAPAATCAGDIAAERRHDRRASIELDADS